MNKSDLKTGMIVTLRRGVTRVIIGKCLVDDDVNICNILENYNDDLTHMNNCKNEDIMKIEYGGKVIWERVEWDKVPFGTKVRAWWEDSKVKYTGRFLAYDDNDSVEAKIEKVSTKVYGAKNVTFSAEANKKLKMIYDMGYDKFPVCIAKTQYSFSTDPKLYGVAKDFTVNVSDIVINAGAEMLVAIAGKIMRMPGLPKEPQALHIDIVNGEIEGLS